jgi:ubiquinone biosynthesis protein Coq4
MPAEAVTARFEAIVASGEGDPAALAGLARKGDAAAAADLGALMARAGYVDPALIIAVYDAAAAGWFGEASAPVSLAGGAGAASPALWGPFWQFLDDETPSDPGTFTLRTARLGDHVDAGFAERAGEASLAYPGVREAAAQGWPDRFLLDDLAACPHGSLGAEFYSLIVDNGFDLEVLDRDALDLANLRPPLDYLNVRILQCHDIWHIVGGYRTTALHEVAISAFQLSQFGHNYSAQFLAFIVTRAALKRPDSYALLLEIILSAWRHGRASPPLLGVAWPTLWDLPTSVIRTRLGVTAYDSPYPADLVEQLTAAQAAVEAASQVAAQ